MSDNTKIQNHKDLTVWQRSMELCEEVYKNLKTFPVDEKFGLTSQIKRCSVSIPSNIAEGKSRGGVKEYIHFLYIALGSASELQIQLELSYRLGFLKEITYTAIMESLVEILKMLHGLIGRLKHLTPNT